MEIIAGDEIIADPALLVGSIGVGAENTDLVGPGRLHDMLAAGYDGGPAEIEQLTAEFKDFQEELGTFQFALSRPYFTNPEKKQAGNGGLLTAVAFGALAGETAARQALRPR